MRMHSEHVAMPHALTGLDGRVFEMVSSTASEVDAGAPTVFFYHENESVLWGEYHGDTVRLGRFVGERLRNDAVAIRFVHTGVDGQLRRGKATIVLESDAQGRLRLIEDFQIEGEAHTSVCREIVSVEGGDLSVQPSCG